MIQCQITGKSFPTSAELLRYRKDHADATVAALEALDLLQHGTAPQAATELQQEPKGRNSRDIQRTNSRSCPLP